MSKGRVEAFSDGVIAIIITIIVLLFDVPDGNDFAALMNMMPLVLMYLVSFILIGTHWVNHHHLFQVTVKVNGRIIWANLLYLFTLSLMPVATGWVGVSRFAQFPTTVYAVVSMAASLSYILLQKLIVSSHDCVRLKEVIDNSKKELVTVILHTLALICSFITPIRFLTYVFLVAMSLLWVIPDIRMSKVYDESNR